MRSSALPATLVLIVIYYCKPTCSKSDISFLCISINTHHIKIRLSGFGGLAVACWPLVPKFAASNPAEAQHALLRMGSKAGGPMS
jgi:hypothetical protein